MQKKVGYGLKSFCIAMTAASSREVRRKVRELLLMIQSSRRAERLRVRKS